MAPALIRRPSIPLIALAGGCVVALVAYRRRMVDRHAVEFHQRYG
jgi:hypothetical protein